LTLPAEEHYALGFHLIRDLRAFSAAAVGCRVFGPHAQRSGIVLSQASVSLQFLAKGAWTDRFQVGWAAAARPALRAMAFAARRSPSKASMGFFRSWIADWSGLRGYEIVKVGLKPNPSWRGAMPASTLPPSIFWQSTSSRWRTSSALL